MFVCLTGRIMNFPPLCRDPGYKEDVFAIDGQAIRETTLAFLDRDANSNILLQLLNEHLPADQYPIELEDLLNPRNSWTHEFAFYLSMFCKEILKDPQFRFGQGDKHLLGKGHKIYENGQMEFVPWGTRPDGSEVRDFALHTARAFILYLEESHAGASAEFFAWLNCLLPPGYRHKEEFLDGRQFWCSLEFMHYSLELYKILTNSNGSVNDVATQTVFQARWLAQFLLPLSRNFIRMAINDVGNQTKEIKSIAIQELGSDRMVVRICGDTALIAANVGPYLASAWENLYRSWLGALTGLFTLKYRDLENIECSIDKACDQVHPDFVVHLSRKIPAPATKRAWLLALLGSAACAVVYMAGLWLSQTRLDSVVAALIASNIAFAALAAVFYIRHYRGKKHFTEQRLAAIQQLQAYERSSSQLLISKSKLEKSDQDQQSHIKPQHPDFSIMADSSKSLLEINLRRGRLSQRDIEVARLVCQGLADKEIATILNVANQTISNRLSRLYRRYDVNSRSALVAKLYNPQP